MHRPGQNSVFLAALALVAAACSGDGSGQGTPGEAPTTITVPTTATSTTLGDVEQQDSTTEGSSATTLGDVEQLDLRPWRDLPAPDAASIAVVEIAPWSLRVSGGPGSVPVDTAIAVLELGSRRGAVVISIADGSFRADVPGSVGTTVQVVPLRAVPSETGFGRLGDGLDNWMHALPSVYVPVRPPAAPAAGASWPVMVSGGLPGETIWQFVGTFEDKGATIDIDGVLRIRANGLTSSSLHVGGLVDKAFAADGTAVPVFSNYQTERTTPSGLPIEGSLRLLQFNPSSTEQPCAPVSDGSDTMTCPVDLTLPAARLTPGAYVVQLVVSGDGGAPSSDELVVSGDGGASSSDELAWGGRSFSEEVTPLGIVTRDLNGPMRLATLLFADGYVAGGRGVSANEDSDKVGWSSRIAWQPHEYTTPPTDLDGNQIVYSLEPIVPQLGVVDRWQNTLVAFDFDYLASSWEVSITDPSGDVTTLGPAPLSQVRSGGYEVDESGADIGGGGGHVTALARLTRADQTFEHRFTKTGLHEITATGHVTGTDGNVYQLGGTYSVLVAHELDLDVGLLPGTPLEVGQPVDRSVQVHPPVPAEITYRFRLWGGADGHLISDDTTTGTANAFGWLHPRSGIVAGEPGEYRVDIAVTWTDGRGEMHAATYSAGGVVADPSSPLIVHGLMGIDSQLDNERVARFRRIDIDDPGGGNHFNMPYYQGDVAWQTDDDSMNHAVSIDDNGSDIRALMLSRPGGGDTAPWDRGEGMLWSSTTGAGEHFGGSPGVEAYGYTAVERPGERVREMVHDGEIANNYWRFDDQYGMQVGMGPAGDLPNDYKFLFGGAVVRDIVGDRAWYGGYSSLWVEVPDGYPTGSEVNSPFDPAAPPIFDHDFIDQARDLFEPGGQDLLAPAPGPGNQVRAFYEPRGTRAGSLLHVGDRASFGGYIAPLGPQTLDLTITKPSGAKILLSSTANAWGPRVRRHPPHRR